MSTVYRNVLIVVALVAAGLGAFWYFAPREPAVTNYPSSGTDIIAFGDSLVSGVGATMGNDFVSLLSKKTGTNIINLGVPGNTTSDGVVRLHELDPYTPKVVLLLLGGNDYLRRVPPEEAFRNLSLIIEDLHRRGAIVLLLGVRGGVLSDRYRSEYDALHEKYKTAYVPNVLEGLIGKAEYMTDQIHPNSDGYAIIAERIAPVLKELLK